MTSFQLRPDNDTHTCIPVATMTAMTSTHNSIAVNRGYLSFMILSFLVRQDRTAVRFVRAFIRNRKEPVWPGAIRRRSLKKSIRCARRSFKQTDAPKHAKYAVFHAARYFDIRTCDYRRSVGCEKDRGRRDILALKCPGCFPVTSSDCSLRIGRYASSLCDRPLQPGNLSHGCTDPWRI